MNPSVETANNEPTPEPGAKRYRGPNKPKRVRRNYAAEASQLAARIHYAMFSIRAIQRAAKDHPEIANIAQQLSEILSGDA